MLGRKLVRMGPPVVRVVEALLGLPMSRFKELRLACLLYHLQGKAHQPLAAATRQRSASALRARVRRRATTMISQRLLPEAHDRLYFRISVLLGRVCQSVWAAAQPPQQCRSLMSRIGAHMGGPWSSSLSVLRCCNQARSVVVLITSLVAAECVGFVQRRRVQDCFDTGGCCNREGLLQVKDAVLKRRGWRNIGQTNRFVAQQAEALRHQHYLHAYGVGEAEKVITQTVQSLCAKRARGHRFVFLFAGLSYLRCLPHYA